MKLKKYIFIAFIIIFLIIFVLLIINYKKQSNYKIALATITLDDFKEEYSHFKERYQGQQSGYSVIDMISIINESSVFMSRSDFSDLTVFLYQENKNAEVKYKEDLDTYQKELQNLILMIDKEKEYSVEILCDSKNFPTEIKISLYEGEVDTD